MAFIQKRLSIINLEGESRYLRTVIRTTVFVWGYVVHLFPFTFSNFTLLVFPSHERHYSSMPTQSTIRLPASSLEPNGGEKYTFGQ